MNLHWLRGCRWEKVHQGEIEVHKGNHNSFKIAGNWLVFRCILCGKEQAEIMKKEPLTHKSINV